MDLQLRFFVSWMSDKKSSHFIEKSIPDLIEGIGMSRYEVTTLLTGHNPVILCLAVLRCPLPQRFAELLKHLFNESELVNEGLKLKKDISEPMPTPL